MRIAGALLIIVVLSAVGWRYFSDQAAPQRQFGAPGVVLHTVTQQRVTESIDAIGTTKALESLEVTSTITERIAGLNIPEGQRVAKGTVLIELVSDEEAALLKGAKIELREHEREFARIENLVKQKSIPSSELDNRQSLIDGAKARIAEVEARLNERQLRAPFDGVVGLRQVSVGALARPGDVLTTLDAIDLLHVDFTVPEKHLQKLTPNTPISAESIAYPEHTFNGVIATVSPRIDPVSRSVNVRATIDNRALKLRPGMLLHINIINTERDSLAVPEEAVFMRGTQHYVYSVNADNIASETAVTIGERWQGQVEITEGLKPNDNIVLQGLLKVKPGAKVEPQQEPWRQADSSPATPKNSSEG